MSAWTTDLEIGFLKKLGTYSEQRDTGRQELLMRYLESAYKRADWDGMNRAAILGHVRKMLLLD